MIEYNIIPISHYSHPQHLQDELNRLGRLGWKLVTKIEVDKMDCLVLMKPVE